MSKFDQEPNPDTYAQEDSELDLVYEELRRAQERIADLEAKVELYKKFLAMKPGHYRGTFAIEGAIVLGEKDPKILYDGRVTHSLDSEVHHSTVCARSIKWFLEAACDILEKGKK